MRGDLEVARSLAALSPASEHDFGGKSVGLGRLVRLGFPVPSGFALSTAALDAHLDAGGLRALVGARLADLDPDDLASVRAASEAIATAIVGTPMPAALRDQVERRYDALGERQPAVAVRSSARGEDGAGASFAGQQETSLWVRGRGPVCDAVRACWASLYSPPAITYRAGLRSDDPPPAMGVTVQLMVDAEVAGVMFTCSPTTGDPSVVVIEAGWGLGLGVVGGDVTPDELVVSKVTREVLRREVNRKACEHRPDPGGGGTVRVAVPEARRDALCLDDDRLAALVELGCRVDRELGARQDIEWAFARDGSLFVLQARPVTAAPTRVPESGRSALSLVMNRFGVQPSRGG